MDKWQPIETAPKDGTYVIVARFVKGCKFRCYGYAAVNNYRIEGASSSYIGWGSFNKAWPPTHWMPLPPPPEVAND